MEVHPALLSGHARETRLLRMHSERTGVRALVHELQVRLAERSKEVAVTRLSFKQQEGWMQQEVERLANGLEDMSACVQVRFEASVLRVCTCAK